MLKSYEYSQKIRNGAKTRSRNDKLRTAFYLYTSSCPGFPLSFVLEIVRGRHSAPKKNRSKGSKYYSEKYVQFWGQSD